MERNSSLNAAFNTFYLRLYGDRHMVKDHSDSERGNPLLLFRGLLFSMSRSGQVRSGAHSEQVVVANACHGYRYWPSPVSLDFD